MRKIEDRTKKIILKIAVVVFCIALIFGGIMTQTQEDIILLSISLTII